MASLLRALAFACAAAASAAAAAAPSARLPVPRNAVLHAPMTPFTADGAVNISAVPALARDAAASGVNFVFVVGGMGQFDTLTLAERKAVAAAWLAAGRPLGLYICVHVGATAQADAIELATHAASIGADAVASLPPFYERPATAEAVAAWLAPVAAAAGPLAFYYYHIPANTGVAISMASFFPAALRAIPTFAGVKFVSTDLVDFAALVNAYGAASPPLALLFAPEPKLAGVALGATGVVLAESFFAPTWLRMCHAASAGNWAAARAEQAWKSRVVAIFAGYPGVDAERTVYKKLIGVDMGPPRAPVAPLSDADYATLVAQLDAEGFFSQGPAPPPCAL
jgi:N-acetylneuraminate lyase